MVAVVRQTAQKFLDERHDDSSNVQVERIDQERINEFGRLNDDTEGIKAELTQLRTMLANLDDAADELMLGDTERVQYFVGGSFFFLARDEAEKRLAEEKDVLTSHIGDYEARVKANEAKLAQLKVALKAKFKDSINLE